jgi:hypothetical protein
MNQPSTGSTSQPGTTGQATTSRRERLAHAYCARCVPAPALGQRIVALCGTAQTFNGKRPATSGCVVCDSLVTAETLECGHPGIRAY